MKTAAALTVAIHFMRAMQNGKLYPEALLKHIGGLNFECITRIQVPMLRRRNRV